MMFNKLYHFVTVDIHPKICPDGEDVYDDLDVDSSSKRKKMKKLFDGHQKCIAK